MAESFEDAVRLADVAGSELPVGLDDARICYWRQDGTWWIYLPRAGAGRLSRHEIVEHDDGTITAKGSILLRERHGWLERGRWRE